MMCNDFVKLPCVIFNGGKKQMVFADVNIWDKPLLSIIADRCCAFACSCN